MRTDNEFFLFFPPTTLDEQPSHMNISALLATLALLSAAAAAPKRTTTNATDDQLKSISTRLVSVLKNPVAFRLNKDEKCRKNNIGTGWSCVIGDRAPHSSTLSYSAEHIKAILDHVKADTNSGIDFSKIVVTSMMYRPKNWLEYELRGIHKGASQYNFYYVPNCLPTENKEFPSKFKGTTLHSFGSMQESAKEEFRRARTNAIYDNMPLSCTDVYILGSQETFDEVDFGEEEWNALLESAMKY
jgi:hypothetical protein